MGTYKRTLSKGIRWYYSGMYLSVKYHSKAIYRTKKEGEKAERAKKDEIDKNQRRPKIEISLFELCTERLDYLKDEKSKTYYNDNKHYIKELLKAIDPSTPISDITKKQMNDYFVKAKKELKKRGKTNHSVNCRIRCLKALFGHGIDLYELDFRNPVAGIKFYSVDNKLKYIPTQKQINEVKKLCSDDQLLLINFVEETGCRINEALNFCRKDFLDDRIVLYTRKSKGGNLTPRILKAPSCLHNIRFNGKLFKSWSDYPKFLSKKVKKLYHPNWGWHNLRHKFASELSRANVPLFEIMIALGHQNIKTTQGYLQSLGEIRN